MKLTKTKLKQIIKEEINKVLREDQSLASRGLTQDEWMKILYVPYEKGRFEPNTSTRVLAQYAAGFAEWEASIQDFHPEKAQRIRWDDLMTDFKHVSIPVKDAKAIVQYIQKLAKEF